MVNIRVGFFGAVSKEWMGGLNYLKNLLFAISQLEDKNIVPIVFVGRKTDIDIKNMFSCHALLIEHSMFDRKSFWWFAWKIPHKLFGSLYLLDRLLKKHKIQVLSHTGITGVKSCKIINWIPDFQHLHLKDMFSGEEIERRNIDYLKQIKESDAIVLSSYDALKDFKKFAPSYVDKVNVLQFVSQPDTKYFELQDSDKKRVFEKYSLDQDFFYIPNQFWKHKNHMVFFDAIRVLKEKGIDVNVVCTGYMGDYRNVGHVDDLKRFIVDNALEQNIILLGLIDYADVFTLMKYSKAVINPSLFEGWSSTVEECKSVGRNMILSDLDVHKEQYPKAKFFSRNNAVELSGILEGFCADTPLQVSCLEERTNLFALKYLEIINHIILPMDGMVDRED